MQDTETSQARLQERNLSAKPQACQVRLLSSKQAAAYLGISPSSVRRMYYEGQISVVRFGSKLRYDVYDLDAWISRQKERSV